MKCPTCGRAKPGPKPGNATRDAEQSRGRDHARKGLSPEPGASDAYLKSYRAQLERLGRK